MIKEIFSVFTKNSLMDRAFDSSFEMLDLTNDMYLKAKEILRETNSNDIEIDINDRDSTVNKYQRNVRKDVFNHLAVSGPEELASGLVLISIVIDLERIGDYTKNIADIAANHVQKLNGGKFEEKIVEIENAVTDVFERTIKCFRESDVELGIDILGDYKWVSYECDKIIDALIAEEDTNIGSGSAVALAIYVRSLKRIYSHLRNVVTSVVNPFHRIGYKVKQKHIPNSNK